MEENKWYTTRLDKNQVFVEHRHAFFTRDGEHITSERAIYYNHKTNVMHKCRHKMCLTRRMDNLVSEAYYLNDDGEVEYTEVVPNPYYSIVTGNAEYSKIDSRNGKTGTIVNRWITERTIEERVYLGHLLIVKKQDGEVEVQVRVYRYNDDGSVSLELHIKNIINRDRGLDEIYERSKDGNFVFVEDNHIPEDFVNIALFKNLSISKYADLAIRVLEYKDMPTDPTRFIVRQITKK